MGKVPPMKQRTLVPASVKSSDTEIVNCLIRQKLSDIPRDRMSQEGGSVLNFGLVTTRADKMFPRIPKGNMTNRTVCNPCIGSVELRVVHSDVLAGNGVTMIAWISCTMFFNQIDFCWRDA